MLLGFILCGSIKEIMQPSAQSNTGTSFIELKNGQIITGNTIQFPGPAQLDFSKFDPFKKQVGGEDWVGIDGKQYNISEVYGAQDKGLFRAFTHDKIITRLRKGKLNLYWYETDAVVGSNTGFLKMLIMYMKPVVVILNKSMARWMFFMKPSVVIPLRQHCAKSYFLT
jgi:hypothetical protein